MKKKLRTSLLAMNVLLVVLLSAILALSGFAIYRSDMINRYQNYAGDVVSFLAREIDGDDFQTCIETKTKSEHYKYIQKLANSLKETHDLEYIYIIQPLKPDPPDNMMDVLAAVTEYELAYEADTLTDLGNLTGEFYPSEIAAQYIARMDHDPTISFFRNDSDFGRIYTALRPIFNGNGDPIALLCGDIQINEIFGAAQKYAVNAGLVAIAFCALSLLLVNLWIGQRIVGPIGKLQKAAFDFEEKCRRRASVEELTMEDPRIHTGDEIEALSTSIVSMVQDVQNYAKDLIEKETEIHQKETEILSMKEYVSKMDVLAYRDTLTGTGNKAAYEKAVRKLDWDILAGKADFGIVMADLNYLKRINDSYGHDKGNEYIQGLYRLMHESFRESPIFRIGGDEFVILVQDEELDKCQELLDGIREKMNKTMQDSRLEPWQRISTAFGWARYAQGDDVASVFRKADAAMYEEKNRMHAKR